MTGSARCSILLLAADDELRELLGFVVERAGGSPRAACDARMAWRLASASRLAGAVVDLASAEDHRFLRRLRDSGVPLLVLAADDECDLPLSRSDRRLGPLLTKPFSPGALVAWLEPLLAGASKTPVAASHLPIRSRAVALIGVAAACLVSLSIVVNLAIPLSTGPRVPEVAGAQGTSVPTTLAVARGLTAAAAATAPPAPARLTLPAGCGPHPPASVPGCSSPAAASAATPALRPTPTSSALTPDPAERVRQFYAYLGRGDFQNMDWLLTEHFMQTMLWDPKVLRERTPPGKMDVQQADVVAVDPHMLSAVVAVRVREVAGPPLPSVHVYVGTWRLVRGPTGWLMDQPDIELE